MEAELYRANPIESYDTCSVRLHLADDVRVVIGLTHACATEIGPEILIRAQHGEIRYLASEQFEVVSRGGMEHLPLETPMEQRMLQSVGEHLLGEPLAGCVGTLEMARAHTVTVGAIFDAGISTRSQRRTRVLMSRTVLTHDARPAA